MDTGNLSFVAVLDIGFTSFLQKALSVVACVCLPIAGVVAFWLAYEGLFTYDEGLLELSPLEWTAIVLFVLVERRLNYYRRKLGYGWWYGWVRMLRAAGVCAVVWALLSGVSAILIFSLEGGFEAFAEIEGGVWDQPLWLGSLLLSAYLAAPTRPAESLKANFESNEPVDPTPDSIRVECQS